MVIRVLALRYAKIGGATYPGGWPIGGIGAWTVSTKSMAISPSPSTSSLSSASSPSGCGGVGISRGGNVGRGTYGTRARQGLGAKLKKNNDEDNLK